MLFIRPCRPPPPRALHHFTPERSEVYLYRPRLFAYPQSRGFTYTLSAYHILPETKSGNRGENGKTPDFCPTLDIKHKPDFAIFRKKCHLACIFRAVSSRFLLNRRQSIAARLPDSDKSRFGVLPVLPRKGAVEVPHKTSFRGWAGLKQDKKEFLQ